MHVADLRMRLPLPLARVASPFSLSCRVSTRLHSRKTRSLTLVTSAATLQIPSSSCSSAGRPDITLTVFRHVNAQFVSQVSWNPTSTLH